jgi:hypothetical protein
MKKRGISLLISLIIISLNFISSAHYIIGYVENALDGQNSNEKTILLWDYSVGMANNLTDLIGPNGNSGSDNIYMIDCEMLSPPCDIGDTLSLKVINNGDSYVSDIKNVTVSSNGYTLVENITLNSIPHINSVEIDDEFAPPVYPENEIDLNAGEIREVLCKAVIMEYDGEDSIANATAKFFHDTSTYESENDNNTHYSNESCYINKSYGTGTELEVLCSFKMQYYSNSGEWNCTIQATDNFSISNYESNTTNVNEMLAIYVNSTIDFGKPNAGEITDEKEIEVINYGNTKINLSLSGYGVEEGDGFAMVCEIGEIPAYEKKYNLSNSNPGEITLEEVEEKYKNLSSQVVVNNLGLNFRQNEEENEATNVTYWRIKIPQSIMGTCQGNILFGAIESPAD